MEASLKAFYKTLTSTAFHHRRHHHHDGNGNPCKVKKNSRVPSYANYHPPPSKHTKTEAKKQQKDE
jgi:hypothetical protein